MYLSGMNIEFVLVTSNVCSTGGDQKMHLDDINLDKNYTPSGAYGRSKLANILFTVELAKRLKGELMSAVNAYNMNYNTVTLRM